MRFIDLFAGLGGFHIALSRLGHECVFASEVVTELKDIYKKNFGLDVSGDITKIPVEDVPEHDILCAGFPCQAFSKAGRQKGMKEERGKLINSVIAILEYHNPQYFILENVRNLETHDNGKTWAYIENELTNHLGYKVEKKIISPHHIGIPQHRERIFIVGSKDELEDFEWFDLSNNKSDVKEIIDNLNEDSLSIEPTKIKVLELWQRFLDILPQGTKPCLPLWSMEFGATYPYENIDYSNIDAENLWSYKGSFGQSLKGLSKEEMVLKLPNYTKNRTGIFPKWKINIIKKNRKFYNDYKKQIDKILPEIQELQIESWQKFEWNCLDLEKNIWKYLIQFRGSGIRVKRTDFFPSLVTVRTQMPIIGWQKRYISIRECARTQSIPDNIILPSTLPASFKALGNSVNTEIIYAIAKKLIKEN